MEDLFKPFVEFYNQNNFSDFKPDLEENKNKHAIISYPKEDYFRYSANMQKKTVSNGFSDFIHPILDSLELNFKKIIQQYED